jgi:hypothetical protein
MSLSATAERKIVRVTACTCLAVFGFIPDRDSPETNARTCECRTDRSGRSPIVG